jgi:hypothetical protein
MRNIEVAINLYTKLMSDKIMVACTTCGIIFLDKQWREYLPLLNGDYSTPTRWYNSVVIHFCENPSHIIMSNRDLLGYNTPINFSEAFTANLAPHTNVTLKELYDEAISRKNQVMELPV